MTQLENANRQIDFDSKDGKITMAMLSECEMEHIWKKYTFALMIYLENNMRSKIISLSNRA